MSELGPRLNRWRVVCVAGAEPYFERHADGQWAQREQAEAEIERLRSAITRACAGYPADSAAVPTCVAILREALR